LLECNRIYLPAAQIAIAVTQNEDQEEDQENDGLNESKKHAQNIT
jgi:hypothetical protein